jgi:hypothetical protein
VDLFYETVWSCFERHVPTRYFGCEQKLTWMTRELTSLKNNKAKASIKSRNIEKLCLKDDTIDNCANVYEKNLSHSDYQPQHSRAYDDYHARIEDAIKSDPKTFFGNEDLKKKRVGYPAVMHFEGRLASGPRKSVICLRNLYNEHIPTF